MKDYSLSKMKTGTQIQMINAVEARTCFSAAVINEMGST